MIRFNIFRKDISTYMHILNNTKWPVWVYCFSNYPLSLKKSEKEKTIKKNVVVCMLRNRMFSSINKYLNFLLSDTPKEIDFGNNPQIQQKFQATWNDD